MRDGSRATDPDACGGGATHWPAAARVSGGWRLRAVGKYCRRGGRRRDGVCAGAETAPGRHRSTRGEADRRARGGRLACAHGDRGREDDLQGPSGGGGNGERGSPSTPGTQSPAGARLGEGPVYRGVGGAHLQRPAMAGTDRVRNGRKIEKSLARAARRTEPPCPHRVPVTRTQSGASNRKAVRSDQRREITGPQNGSTATRSGIRSQALSSPAGRPWGEPAVRHGAARERRRSAYEAPHGSVAPGPVSSGAESKRRRCPRSRAR